MPTYLVVVLFLATFAAVFFLGAARLAGSSVLGSRLRVLSGPNAAEAAHKLSVSERFQEKVLDPLAQVVPKSPEEVSHTRQLLMMAGYREQKHLAYYYGIRVLLAAGLPLLAFVTTLDIRRLDLLIGMAALGFLLPRFVLKRMIKHRQHDIRLSLADALDLAVICVEAGLGLDQTLQRVGLDLKHTHPALSDELNLVNLEMRAGKARVEALRNLASRTGVDDVRALVAVLIQTDRFGTSVAQALRVHSDAMRTERRQRAEEQAAKTTIKMVPALVFFVFPSMFIVSLGPAFIQLVRNLLPEITK